MPRGIFGTRIFAGLTTLFNVLALNLAMIVASLPLITAPVAVSAAAATLDQWRRDGEDRVIRQFVLEFRHRWSARTTLGAGVPMAAAVLGLAVPGLQVANAGTVAKTFPEFTTLWGEMFGHEHA